LLVRGSLQKSGFALVGPQSCSAKQLAVLCQRPASEAA
jgi:hypothetical protein